MKSKNTIRIASLALVLAGAFFVFNSTAASGKKKAVKESMEECCKKPAPPSKTVWEGLSQQFFSSI